MRWCSKTGNVDSILSFNNQQCKLSRKKLNEKNTFKKIVIDKKNCGFWKQFSNIQFAHIIFENKYIIFVMATIEFQLIMMQQIVIRGGANDKSTIVLSCKRAPTLHL